MSNVDRLLGKPITEAAAGGAECADVSVTISGKPNHVKKALKDLAHKSAKGASFGKKLTGQVAPEPKAPKVKEPKGEEELDIEDPHEIHHESTEEAAIKLVDQLLEVDTK